MANPGVARRLYWRMLDVPGIGRRARRVVDGTRAMLRRTVAEDVEALRDVVAMQSAALAGLGDTVEEMRRELDALRKRLDDASRPPASR